MLKSLSTQNRTRTELTALIAKITDWYRGTQHMWMAHRVRPSFPSHNKNLSSLLSLLACRIFSKHKYNWVRMVIIFLDEKNENPERWVKSESLIIEPSQHHQGNGLLVSAVCLKWEELLCWEADRGYTWWVGQRFD